MYLLGATEAPAAPAVNVPGSADAGRVLNNLKPVNEPTFSAPEVVVSPQVGAPAPPGAETKVFLFNQVAIEGVTAYDRNEQEALLESIFKPYVHQYMSVQKLYELTETVTQRYHNDGYALSRAVIPPQDLTDGRVRIQVVEGYIDAIETAGTYRESALTDAIFRRIKSYRPLNIKDLEHDMLLLNDLPGVTAHAEMKPPENSPGHQTPTGATDLALIFTDVPVETSATVDNAGSRYNGPYQMQVQTGINDLVMPYQQTRVSGMVALPEAHELEDVQVSHRMPLNSQGTIATLEFGYVRTQPGYNLESSDIVSNAYDYDVAVSHPLSRSRAQNLFVGGDFMLKDTATDALTSQLYDDTLRIASVSANYDNSDRWGGANQAQLKVSQGLDVLGASKNGSSDLSRADGHSDFTRVTGNVSRLQNITNDVSLFAAGTGQYAWSPLLSSEQFGFGGQQFGRAYDYSELTGDDGVSGMMELRYSGLPEIPRGSEQLFAFYDIGRVWNYGASAEAESAASAGVGFRFTFTSHLSGSLTLAQPLTRKVAAPEYGHGEDSRVFFSLTMKN